MKAQASATAYLATSGNSRALMQLPATSTPPRLPRGRPISPESSGATFHCPSQAFICPLKTVHQLQWRRACQFPLHRGRQLPQLLSLRRRKRGWESTALLKRFAQRSASTPMLCRQRWTAFPGVLDLWHHQWHRLRG